MEYALEYLIDALEDAGIADDTVIVLTADHYPYAMAEDDDVDYYVELTGIDDNENLTSRYQNTLILWSGSMDETVEVDAPCTAIDIVPTLLNLFGMDYDSRLLSGRDVLAPDVEVGTVDTNMHVALFADCGYGNSWITAAGTYEAYTDTFTPAEGVVLEDEDAYVSAVTRLVQNRYSYAKYIVQEDYYSHVFPNWTGGMSLVEALGG
ncbi:MAG: sulfatase-like hydrolase/transferase [Oscillospiraceae bacterium]|nr:sulfatase-like hydrolase/transferase [Oscillospiraceae bacterium]